MSIGALAQEILADTHSLVSATTVYRKLLSAMRFSRDKRLWFSERTFSFNLQAGVSAYSPGNGPPRDMVEVVGRTLWVLIGGSQDNRWPVNREPSAQLEYFRQDGTGQSQPDVWDWHAQQLRFYPTPNSSDDVVEGRYVVDIGVPVVKWEAGAFMFYAPDGLTKLSTAELEAFSNDWTEPGGAGDMIRCRASYLLYRDSLKNPEAANDQLAAWLEQTAQLENETEARTAGATEIAGYIL